MRYSKKGWLDDYQLPPEETEHERLLEQFPPEPPPVWTMETDTVDNTPAYSEEPPDLTPIALLKSKYATEQEAYGRALELATKRGLKIHRFFETAAAWVAQCYRAQTSFPPDLGF